jgi:hypothetical protein
MFILPHPICNYVHRIMLQFCLFLHIYPSCGQILSPCLTSGLSCAILSQAGLLEVLATYLGVLWLFSCSGPVLLNGCSLEKVMLMGGPSVQPA